MNGLKVVSFESRRAAEIAKLISGQGGIPVIAPALREVTLEENPALLEFLSELRAGRFHVVVFLTGVGTRTMFELLEKRYKREELVAALAPVAVVARGPKAAGVLRELGVSIAATAAEPNTWREVIAELDARKAGWPLAGRRIAVQEYGAPNPEFLQALEDRRLKVTRVPVYRWELPDDIEPLRSAIRAIIAGEIGIAMFTSAIQLTHLLKVARQDGAEEALRAGLARVVIASIGPTTSAALREQSLEPDLEPQHPRMGFLVKEVAEQAPAILSRKRV